MWFFSIQMASKSLRTYKIDRHNQVIKRAVESNPFSWICSGAQKNFFCFSFFISAILPTAIMAGMTLLVADGLLFQVLREIEPIL